MTHKQINDGGPAFPRDHRHDGHNGMTLRDYFAGQALMGVTRELTIGYICDLSLGVRGGKQIADAAYQIADAMLTARSAPLTPGGEA